MDTFDASVATSEASYNNQNQSPTYAFSFSPSWCFPEVRLCNLQVERLAIEVGSGLLNEDLVPQRVFTDVSGSELALRCIGIFAKNREEWVITEHACEFQLVSPFASLV